MDAGTQNNLSKRMASASSPWLLSALVCLLFVVAAAPLNADTVTLNSGEVLQGMIVSETDTQIEMEVSMYHGSIIAKRQVLRTDIKSIIRESLQQQREKAVYNALSIYTLNPTQELTRAQYAAGIASFQKFLATYTNSSYAADINKRIADWRAESSNVESGKVKFADQWMTPAEKRTQMQASPESLQILTNRLVSLQADRKKAEEDLRVPQTQLTDAQKQLASLKDTTEPKYDPATGAPIKDERGNPEYKKIPNPERPDAEKRVAAAQSVVNHGRETLNALERQISDVQTKIRSLQLAQQQALIKSNAPAKKVVTQAQPSTTNTNASPTKTKPNRPPPSNAAPGPPPPWYVRLWNWL